MPPKIKTDDRGPPKKAHSQLLGPQLAHEPCVWFAAHVASHHRSGACISLVIQEGLQAHSEEVGQIRTTIGYVCSLIQAVPPLLIITKEPQSKACRLKGGLDHTIHGAKSLIGCGTSNMGQENPQIVSITGTDQCRRYTGL